MHHRGTQLLQRGQGREWRGEEEACLLGEGRGGRGRGRRDGVDYGRDSRAQDGVERGGERGRRQQGRETREGKEGPEEERECEKKMMHGFRFPFFSARRWRFKRIPARDKSLPRISQIFFLFAF